MASDIHVALRIFSFTFIQLHPLLSTFIFLLWSVSDHHRIEISKFHWILPKKSVLVDLTL